jgi:glutamyl-tRNA synthetase
MAEQMSYYFVDDSAVEYEAEAVRKHVKDDELAQRLRELHDVLADVEPFDVAAAEAALRKLAEQRGIGAGKLIHPLRLALTGRAVSPPVFDVAAVLGRDRTLRRISRLIDQVPQLSAT